MPPKRELSIRVAAHLREALDQAAAEQGQTITAIVETALSIHLGVDGPEQGQTLADRVRELEARVAALEGNASQRHATPHTAPAIVGTVAPAPSSTRAAPSGEGTKGIARKLPSRSGVGSSTKGKPENAYSVPEALIAAGVCNESWDGRTITEAQVRDQRNRDRTLERVAGMKGGPLLESMGWVKDGHWWYRG